MNGVAIGANCRYKIACSIDSSIISKIRYNKIPEGPKSFIVYCDFSLIR